MVRQVQRAEDRLQQLRYEFEFPPGDEALYADERRKVRRRLARRVEWWEQEVGRLRVRLRDLVAGEEVSG